MALKSLTGAVFLNGVLVSGTWTPSEPELIITGRSSSKTRYTVYPTIKDDIDGTGVFVDLTTAYSYARVALTFAAANTLQTGIEQIALYEDENKNTTGRYYETNRVIGAYTHEYTVEVIQTKMVEWAEGPPEEAE